MRWLQALLHLASPRQRDRSYTPTNSGQVYRLLPVMEERTPYVTERTFRDKPGVGQQPSATTRVLSYLFVQYREARMHDPKI